MQAMGGLWESLTAEQQKRILEAYEESEDETNFIPPSVMWAKYPFEE